MTYSFLPEVFERWKADWIDPALDYVDGLRSTSDSHLNSVSIEYPELEVSTATDDYAPKNLLGSGTFGSVFRGTMKDGTEVAIKVLQVPEEAGFEEEVQVLSRFRHPNLVILMGFARHTETGGRSLIYEYLSGGDVSKRLQQSRRSSQGYKPFDARLRLSVALDAASGLSHLHNATPRAFHRDIKGPNILLDKYGTAKMADFGLAVYGKLSALSMLSNINGQNDFSMKVAQASGTVGYACPEYIRTGIIKEASEVHSFGMVLLELLTPAVPKPAHGHHRGQQTEFYYLVDHLQFSIDKVFEMLDDSANFPQQLAKALTELAFKCIQREDSYHQRPLFKELVDILRRYLAQHDASSSDVDAGCAVADRSSSKHQQQQSKAPATCDDAVAKSNAPLPEDVLAHTEAVGQAPVPTRTVAVSALPMEKLLPEESLSQRDAERIQNWHAQMQQEAAFIAAGSPASPSPCGAALGPPQASSQRSRSNHLGERSPALQNSDVLPVACRLCCVFAEGVDLSVLTDDQRYINFPAAPSRPAAPTAGGTAEAPPVAVTELFVGRNGQPSGFWENLIREKRLRGTVSREHFKVVSRRGAVERYEGAERVMASVLKPRPVAAHSFALQCLSANGVYLNGEFVAQGSEERLLQHGDLIALAAAQS
eukprot:CAMPEP_0178374818 /NCGR_PEP_ID=MMETSP0689_2-20121128/2569_1 /TAXON_ID=160604 /ORGANISM="Amphidinium massartii, Strain CS-259" /LENGTH=651 /DNA_ID=CAMNT_0019994793 /DNA_START=77 /DNA_END=2029 /DNA_ORIENTATION=-